jgi:hypothetical protein
MVTYTNVRNAWQVRDIVIIIYVGPVLSHMCVLLPFVSDICPVANVNTHAELTNRLVGKTQAC